MAAGCIPIVTRISGMPEAVNSPAMGWVVPPEDPEELCKAMKGAMTLDTAARQQMAENALQRVKRDFDLAETHRKIFEICGL
jgi:glycosyltransferase involved in cell wall biosynthesis